jgi:hypothetical protein
MNIKKRTAPSAARYCGQEQLCRKTGCIIEMWAENGQSMWQASGDSSDSLVSAGLGVRSGCMEGGYTVMNVRDCQWKERMHLR